MIKKKNSRRKKTIKKINLKNYIVLKQKDVNLLYKLTKITINILDKAGVKYWATDGTLLGIIRSKGFIPWDDDVDLAIDSKQKKDILLLKKDFESYGLKLVGVGKYLKVKYPKNKNVWIDIFVLTNGAWPQDHFKHLKFKPGELFPLKKGKFGNLHINIPNKSREYLDRIFKDWNKVAYIYNHHTKGKKKISFKDHPELKKPKLPTN